MCSPYSVSFVFGLALLHLPTTVASCPPSNPPAGAETIQFCSGSEVTSNTIYIDSSDVSNRVTNCTCNFNVRVETTVNVVTTSNQVFDCRTNIKYGQENSLLTNYCGTINGIIVTHPSFNYSLKLTNGQVGIKTYCLKLLTDVNTIKINVRCFKDKHLTTTSTSTEPSTTTKGITAFNSTPVSSINDISNTCTTTSKFTVQYLATTATSTNTDENKGLPVHILAPAAGGGVLVVIVIIILAIVYSRLKRKRKHQYDEPGPKADSHSYMNQAVVHDDENDGDDMRDNELYRSMDSDPLEDDNIGGYAEINLTDPRDKNTFIDISGGYAEVETSTRSNISNTNSTTTHKGQTMHSVPINRSLKQVQGGVVYSMPVKKPKTQKHENDDASMYAIQDKKENQQDLETGPVYAIVNKKTKNEPKNSKTNASKPPINKKPPIVTPKPSVTQSRSEVCRGNENTDGLHYSDIELINSRTTSSSLEFNVSDKTGYAEVL